MRVAFLFVSFFTMMLAMVTALPHAQGNVRRQAASSAFRAALAISLPSGVVAERYVPLHPTYTDVH